MKGDPEQRALLLGEYIVEQGATVRAAARAFGCSKSTVHKDVSVRLRTVGPELFWQVLMVLARNKAERHLRGGAATRFAPFCGLGVVCAKEMRIINKKSPSAKADELICLYAEEGT